MPKEMTFNFHKDEEPDHFEFSSEKADNDSLAFLEEEHTTNSIKGESYKILVVDDEEDIHSATKLIFNDFEFKGKTLEVMHAYSAKEAHNLLKQHNDIALVLLDVVMETPDAGLKLAVKIRTELQNPLIRIVLRTGQPGYAPERKVVLDYDINDYKTKTELTANKVITVLVASLRAYDSLIQLRDLNENLQEIVDERTIELKEKNIQLEAANAAKNKLFSIIGHDLRGPIGNVKNMLAALVNQPSVLSTSAAQTVIKQLHKNAAQTYSLLDNLLMWARNEQGEASFLPQNFDLNLAVYESVTLLESLATDKNLKIRTNISNPNPVFADRRMISTVLRNLVANAIKFSKPSSEISIHLSTQKDNALVQIIDQGIGIKTEDIDKILDTNEVFTTYGTKNEKGSGLGINLCSNFVKRNGGVFSIKSIFGKGSTFSFTVPLFENE